MRDSEGQELRFFDGLPYVQVAGRWQRFRPSRADLADDERGPWLLNHANCVVCDRPISLKRVRDAFTRRRWPMYCTDTHRERAKKRRQRKRS